MSAKGSSSKPKKEKMFEPVNEFSDWDTKANSSGTPSTLSKSESSEADTDFWNKSYKKFIPKLAINQQSSSVSEFSKFLNTFENMLSQHIYKQQKLENLNVSPESLKQFLIDVLIDISEKEYIKGFIPTQMMTKELDYETIISASQIKIDFSKVLNQQERTKVGKQYLRYNYIIYSMVVGKEE